MPARRNIIDDVDDEAYEDEESQSSDNFSDLVDEEDDSSKATSASSSSRTNEASTNGPKKRGRKPKNEPKPKRAPTGRPRGRPRKNPVVTTQTVSKPLSPADSSAIDGLFSLGQAAALALGDNESELNPSGLMKQEEELISNLTTPISPATPLYPLKKRFLAMAPLQTEPVKEVIVEKAEVKSTPSSASDQSPQPVKRRPGRPRKADKQQQSQQQQQQQPIITQQSQESSKDDSDAKKMTSRQQILYLKKLEEKKDSDDEDAIDMHEDKEEKEEKEGEVSLELDSDESEEESVKKPKKTKRKILKKKSSSPWTRVGKTTIKYKGRSVGSFEVSLLGSDSSFELGFDSPIDITQKIALDRVEDIESTSFYILSFSSRSKSEEDKLEETYNTFERDNSVGSISFDDRILLLIPKKSRFLKPLGLLEVQDDPCKFIGALMMKNDSSPERTPRKKAKSPTTPKSPTPATDEDIKRKQLSLLSIPKIPKNKASLNTPTEITPPAEVSAFPDVKTESTTPSTAITPTNMSYPQVAVPSNMRAQPINQASNNPAYSNPLMYNNIPKNNQTDMSLMASPNVPMQQQQHMQQNSIYEKPLENSQYQQSQQNRYQDTYHNMQDQYHNSGGYPMHMQQNMPNHNMPMDMKYYDSYDNDLKRKRMAEGYNTTEPSQRPISPKRRKNEVPAYGGVQYPPYQQQQQQQQHASIPPTTSTQSHDIYHRQFPAQDNRKPMPPVASSSNVIPPPPPPPPSSPPMMPTSTHHSYGAPNTRFSQSNNPYPHYNQSSIPPRRPESSNYGYNNNKPFTNSKPYYKNEEVYDDYDRQNRYNKDTRYQTTNNSSGGINSYNNRRPNDNYSNNVSYNNNNNNGMDDYDYYRKPSQPYGQRRSYSNTPPEKSVSTDVQTPPSAGVSELVNRNPPPPPPPPPPPVDNSMDDYNDKDDLNIAEAAEPTRHLWVGRFHNMKMDYTTIYGDFEKFGPIDSLNLLRDQKCAFVNFAHVKDAIRAKKDLEGTKKYKKIAYQRREKKTSTYSSDYKKPYKTNDAYQHYQQ